MRVAHFSTTTYRSVTSAKLPPSRRRHLTKRTELIKGTEVSSSTVRVTLNLYFFFFMMKVILSPITTKHQPLSGGFDHYGCGRVRLVRSSATWRLYGNSSLASVVSCGWRSLVRGKVSAVVICCLLHSTTNANEAVRASERCFSGNNTGVQ